MAKQVSTRAVMKRPVVPAVSPDKPGSAAAAVTAELSGLSHVGRKRTNNEDSFLIARLDRTWRTLVSNLPPEAVPTESCETAYGLLVADGMGGHAGGEIASRAAISTFVDLVLRTPDVIMRLDPHFTEEALRRLAGRFERIKEALYAEVRRDPSLAGMGTTMTLACTIGAELMVAHVGDSRAYLYRDGVLQRLTRDQTMAQFLADTGMLHPDEIDKHPLRHVLTGALGTSGGPMDVDLRGLRLHDGDQILLCTDGLTDMLSEGQIKDVLASSTGTVDDDCQRLIDLALEAGGRDNVTVVIGRYRAPVPPKP